MELNPLRYFYEVARHGSFTAASRVIRVSQPSLSKMIRQLEEREGVQLFTRGKRGVELTDEGKLVFQSCQAIFRELDALKSALQENREEVSGELSLGASDNLCNYVLPQLLTAFRELYPRVVIRLFSGTASQIQAEIREGRAEFGLFYTKVREGREFESHSLKFVEFVIVCAGKGKSGKLDFKSAPFIGSRSADYSRPYPVLEMMRSIGVDPKLAIESNNQETQKKMALLGAGFTLLPLHMVKTELDSGQLRRIPSPKKLGSWVSVVRRRGRALSRVARLFHEELRKV